jgi:hypothetical protein
MLQVGKVAGSIADEVNGIFNWPNPSSRTVALGSTQPLTKMSTRNIPGRGGGVKSGRHVRLQSHRRLRADYLKNAGASLSHNPMFIHGLLYG